MNVSVCQSHPRSCAFLQIEVVTIYSSIMLREFSYCLWQVSYVLGTEDYMCRKKKKTIHCNGHTNHSDVSLARAQGLDRLLMSFLKG